MPPGGKGSRLVVALPLGTKKNWGGGGGVGGEKGRGVKRGGGWRMI